MNNKIFKSSGYDDEQKAQMGAALSFGNNADDNWKGSGHGPTQIESAQPFAFGAPQQMMGKAPVQTGIRMEAMGMNMDALKSEQFSFGMQPLQMKPEIQVISNPEPKVIDFSEFKAAPAFFVPSKCKESAGLQPTPLYYNEMTSVVLNQSPATVLQKMEGILNEMTNDIDFQVDSDNFQISGQAFVRNLAVFFKITVWDDSTQSNESRLECRRTKGDSVAFTDFWNKVEQALSLEFPTDNVDEDEFDLSLEELGGLPPLDYNLTLDLDKDDLQLENDSEEYEHSGLTPKDVEHFVYEMKESDPCVVYSLAMFIEAVQTTSVALLLGNAAFMDCLIKSALKHQDTALVRGALVMLEKLCESKGVADSLMEYQVLEHVIPLLSHEVSLIRKYAVRVLCKLCSAQSWKLEHKLRAFAEHSVKECRAKFDPYPNDFIQKQMFDDIHSKLLVSVQ